MNKFGKIDMIGKRFGRLTVLKQSDKKNKNGSVFWESICDCGKSTITNGAFLRSGHTKSCGCLHKDVMKGITLSKNSQFKGKRFGRLVVVRDSGERDKGGNIIWECSCDCGGKTNVIGSSLKRGNTTSCGCLQKEIIEKVRKTQLKEETNLNQLDKKVSKASSTGHKGVYRNGINGGWSVRQTFKGVRKNFGTYKDISDAIKAKKEAEEKYFKPIMDKYKQEDIQ